MGKSIFSLLKADQTTVANGVVIDYGEAGKWRLAYAGPQNKAFAEVVRKKFAPYQVQINTGTMDEAAMSRLIAELYADNIVLGWEGVFGEDGEPLKFTRENVIMVLMELPEFFADIQNESKKLANFRTVDLGVEEKN